MAPKITLGSRLRALRLEAKLSQRDLADRVAKRLKEDDRGGFDFTYLSKIENDRLVLDMRTVFPEEEEELRRALQALS